MKIKLKKPEDFLKLLLVASVLVLLCLIIWLNVMTSKTQLAFYDRFASEPFSKSVREIFYLNPSLDDFFIEMNLFNIDWVEYKTKNYDITFQYPSDFQLIKDESKITYQNGEKWETVFFRSYSRKQKVGFSLYINPDGIGIPIDKKYAVISENGARQVILEKVYNYPGSGNEMLDDGRMGLETRWEEGGHWLQFIFSYQIDGEDDGIDYEKMFQDIIKSFKFEELK